jgi:Bacteriophage baseplate protein W
MSFNQTTVALAANWRLAFTDAEGLPLNMESFEQIDFGAISYKEIFQNVKTICATPIFSAALERTLGIDGRIVDLPLGKAAEATVAFLQAIYFWEPRAQAFDIQFHASELDVLSGHLVVTLQLNIRNVIYGTDTPYTSTAVFGVPAKVQQGLIQIVPEPGPPGPPGGVGATGPRGSLWFQGSGPPTAITVRTPVPGPPGQQGEQGKQGQRGSEWFTGVSDPVTPQLYDKYLNTTNGDVWEFDGVTWRKT